MTFDDGGRDAVTVDDLSFTVEPGETLGVVGESGSGKSMTSLAILGLLPAEARVSGSIRFRGRELVGRDDEELRRLRGNEIAMISQDALASLNPVHTVGDQLVEAIRAHRSNLPRDAIHRRVIECLELVGIPSPHSRVDQYPHEFSGGMRQRAMIAMGLVNEPALLIADEPTTALDVTVQAQVLDVFREIQTRTGTSIIFITHDLGVVAGIADRVLVMYAGRQVEDAATSAIFSHPAHPYSAGLLASLPRHDRGERGAHLFQIAGQPPSPTALPHGCRFAPRCAHAIDGRCTERRPQAVDVAPRHHAYCARVGELGDLKEPS